MLPTVIGSAITSYSVAGRHDPVHRRLSLAPVGWIRQSPGYEMVGLGGTVSADLTTYSGAIRNPSCSSFTVSL